MGFGESKNSINRVREVLDLVLASDGTKLIQVPTKTPTKLSYAMYEALKIASKLKPDKSDYKYAKIKTDYIIRCKPDRIVFEPRVGIDIGNALAQSKSSEDKMVLKNVSSLFEIVGAVIQHKADAMVFPDADLEDTDRLEKWCHKNDYIVANTVPLTLRKNVGPATEEGGLSQFN